jgi:RND family efflux transporter MFP subunit
MNQVNAAEDRLRAEIEALKRQMAEQNKLLAEHARRASRPSTGALVSLALLLAALTAGGFFAGYLPRHQRVEALAAETQANSESSPVVTVVRVARSDTKSELVLPGNIQALTEAPVLARASGYLKQRYVDIGDHVRDGQTLAEIEAPELDQQIQQAKSARDQANSAAEQAEAALKQGQTNEALARVTAERWRNLAGKGVVSRQENDTYQAQWAAQQANVEALGKAIAAAKSNAGAAQANLDRLNSLKDYLTVRAPFAGVITLRNVDTGALITEGSTLLFRVAQAGRLRTYVNVPQSESASVRLGQPATLTVADLPGLKFPGTVTHTSNALDPATRTLLTEVQLVNPDTRLVPGMYAQVDLSVAQSQPSLTVKGDTLVVRADGPQVAVVDAGGKVHYARIRLGRDYGDHLEVLAGLEEGQQVVVNPSDLVREGARVRPVSIGNPAAGSKK